MKNKEEIGVNLAKKIISLNHSCDMSKLNNEELSRLKEVVDIARTMFVDTAEYNPEDDQEFIG